MIRLLAIVAWLIALPAAAQRLDAVPRTVVMTAFPPEWNALAGSVADAREHRINGRTFLAGTIAGRPVLLVESGVSMVNAAMTTQLVLDRFTVRRIVFSGIAGGADPALAIGDVVVPEHWRQYLEVVLARAAPGGGWAPAHQPAGGIANYGMIFPRPVSVGNAAEPAAPHDAFDVDPALIALARRVATRLALDRCAAAACLDRRPAMAIGGTGVSGGAFVDNAEYRAYLHIAFDARVIDMETAAVAHVAYANSVPMIAFRSLSDLAGGDAGANRMTTFMALAAGNSARVVRAFVAALPD